MNTNMETETPSLAPCASTPVSTTKAATNQPHPPNTPPPPPKPSQSPATKRPGCAVPVEQVSDSEDDDDDNKMNFYPPDIHTSPKDGRIPAHNTEIHFEPLCIWFDQHSSTNRRLRSAFRASLREHNLTSVLQEYGIAEIYHDSGVVETCGGLVHVFAVVFKGEEGFKGCGRRVLGLAGECVEVLGGSERLPVRFYVQRPREVRGRLREGWGAVHEVKGC